MTEKTTKPIPARLRGIPKGMICRSLDVKQELSICHVTWQRWRDEGLDARYLPGSDTEFVSTDSLHALFEAAPKYRKKP